MRVLLAGATGVIGVPLVRALVAAGHEVFGLTRRQELSASLEREGASPLVCDVFDRERLREVAVAARPEAVIHQLTALPKRIHPRRVRRQLAPTNRLRTEGTRHLLEAARAAGASRFLAQSVAFGYAPGAGDRLREPDDPLLTDVPAAFAELVGAVASLEEQTTSARDLGGTVLRYGFFTGPGTVYAEDGTFAEDVRRRRVPILGAGSGVFSFIHVDDAADATVAALTSPQGVYNVVDDGPAPVREWLPAYARALGAPPPRRVPRWLGRLVGGPYAVYLMCELPGVSNAGAKAGLGWRPVHPSFVDELRAGGRAMGREPRREPAS
jgi:nucleoside-diphosphate-sugar epimerase